MKTAISIPDKQFKTAEQLAVRLGLSRNELYQKALAEFIARHTDESITKTLDNIYAEEHTEDIDKELLQFQANSIPTEDW